MLAHGDAARVGSGPRPAREEPHEALGRELEPGEPLVHRLESGRAIRHETEDGTTEELEPDGDEPAVLAITDRRILLGTPDAPIEVPFRDVRDVTVDSGILRSTVDVRVWNSGAFRFWPSRGQDVGDAAEFLERASTVRQRVLAALEDAREHVTSLGKAIESGDEPAIEAFRDDVQHSLSLSARRIDDAPEVCRDGLEALVSAAETELQRTRVHAHLARGQALRDEAEARAGVECWMAAEEALHRGRKHLETALSAAVERDFGLVGSIQGELDRLDERAVGLAERQRTLFAEATHAAQAADAPESAVPAWAAALEHARAAARFDWAERLGLDRDAAGRRRDVEVTAGRLVEARRHLAERLRADAEFARLAGEVDVAIDRYESATNQLRAAEDVARELAAGDPDRLAARRADLAAQAAALRALDAVEEKRTVVA